MVKENYDVAIFGAGITGLAAAYELAKHGKKVIILEKSNKIGGLLHSYKISDYFIEAFYHHIFPTDKYLLKLFSELGLRNKVLWEQPLTGFYYKRKVYGLLNLKDLIKFKPLSWIDKFYFLKLMLIIKLYKNINKLENQTAREWIIKNSSIGVWNTLFKRLLVNKWGNDYKKISAAWFATRIKMRSNRGRKGEKLGYLDGGFQRFIDILIERLKELNVTFLNNVEIDKIKLNNNEVESIDTKYKKIYAKDFVSTIPINNLVKYLPKNFKNKIKRLDYQGTICVLLGLKKNLTNNFYWVNIMEKDLPFGAYIEHTNFIKDGYKNQHIVYLASYPDFKSNVWKMKDYDIFNLYLNHLKRMFQKINDNDIIWWKISRERYASIVYKKGIHLVMPDFKLLNNLYLGGLFNAYHGGINEGVHIGVKLANLILQK